MNYLASPRLTRTRRATLRIVRLAVALAFLVGVSLLGVAYLAGGFEVRQITDAVSGSGCGLGTKVIEFGEVKCVPPPGHGVHAP